jgi:hypothetical protein
MRWKSDPMTGRYPWYRVAWHLFWFLPTYFFRSGFTVCIFVMFGADQAKRAWDVNW